MILRYFIIVIKDSEGFIVPYLVNNTPLFFPSKEIADNELKMMRSDMDRKLDYRRVKDVGVGKFFRRKPIPNQSVLYNEEQKTTMRWFISTSSVREVTVTL